MDIIEALEKQKYFNKIILEFRFTRGGFGYRDIWCKEYFVVRDDTDLEDIEVYINHLCKDEDDDTLCLPCAEMVKKILSDMAIEYMYIDDLCIFNYDIPLASLDLYSITINRKDDRYE